MPNLTTSRVSYTRLVCVSRSSQPTYCCVCVRLSLLQGSSRSTRIHTRFHVFEHVRQSLCSSFLFVHNCLLIGIRHEPHLPFFISRYSSQILACPSLLHGTIVVGTTRLHVIRIGSMGWQSNNGISDSISTRSNLGLVMHVVKVKELLLVSHHFAVLDDNIGAAQFGKGGFISFKKIRFRGWSNIVHACHPSMPFGRNTGRIKVIHVARFDPTVLTKWIIHTVLIITISCCITSHVCTKLEWIISIRVHVKDEIPPSSTVF
mmetsp:Transcript_25933/g.39734  ORF Transcript_25933/g.39734 Transcript_25933/m.39734 type:complete len:261 (-) Transcript_25933:91-873(-)